MKRFLLTLTFLFLSISSYAANGPIKCAIKTYNGHYLTAVGGGGRITDTIHSDATQIQAWERFELVCGIK
jgi:hypothetical protein